MDTCLICNSRSAAAARFEPLIRQLAARHGWRLHFPATSDDARRIARAAVHQGFRRLIVAGGDGAVSDAVNGIAPDFAPVALAVLPLGTGNDLARCLGMPLDDPTAASEIIAAGNETPIDIVRDTDDGVVSYFVNAANGGFGGVVAADVAAADKLRWGVFAYWMTAIAKLVDLRPYHVELQLDEVPVTADVYGLAVANGRYLGGGFPIAPQAMLDDGLLEITAIPQLPTLELLAAGLEYALEQPHHSQRLASFRARTVLVRATPELPFSVDGEPTRVMDAKFEVLPRCLRAVVGPNSEGVACSSATRSP